MLNNITIKVPGETVATLTAPQCDMIINKTFCFLFVGDFFLFPLCFSIVSLSEEQEWLLTGKQGWTVLVILHLPSPF